MAGSNKILFTPDRLRKLPAPEKDRKFYYDTKQACLALQVTAAGSKTFKFYKYRRGHSPIKITLGNFREISITTARDKARAIAGHIAMKGEEKALDRWHRKPDGQVFDDLFDKWVKKQHDKGNRDIHNAVRRYENHVKPELGNKPISAIDQAYLRRWFEMLLSRKKKTNQGPDDTLSPTTANRCLALVSSVFSTANLPNPTKDIGRHPKVERKRFLTAGELWRLGKVLGHEDTPVNTRDIVLLALLTGARQGNIFNMRWQDLFLDNNRWLIPAEFSKNKDVLVIYLPEKAVEILKRREKERRSISQYVFPANSKTGHINNIKKSFATVLKRAGITGLRFHDLRRTLGSWQAMTGTSELIIGKSLGHKSQESTKAYAHFMGMGAVQESVDKAIDQMDKHMNADSKVVNLRPVK